MVTAEQDNVMLLTAVTLIAGRLHRRYPWVDSAELLSAAGIGVVEAGNLFRADGGMRRNAWLVYKGKFLAADHMRQDGIIRRPRQAFLPQEKREADFTEDTWKAIRALEETFSYESKGHLDDLLEWVLSHIPDPTSRKIFRIRFESDGEISLEKIGEWIGVTESAVALRMQKVLARLQRAWLREFGTCPTLQKS